MQRIDLIIDALEKIINACKLYDRQVIQDGGTVYLEEELEASIKALDAARGLRALKPVVKVIAEDGGVCFELLDKKLLVGTPLYALPAELSRRDVSLIGEGNKQNLKLAQDEIDLIVEAQVVDAIQQGLNG